LGALLFEAMHDDGDEDVVDASTVLFGVEVCNN